MGTDLATELAELLSVDVEDLPVTAAGAHVARLEQAWNRLAGEVLDTLARFDTSQAWRLDTSYSLANWLNTQVGTSKTDATRRTRLAQRLQSMPATLAALRAGSITMEHARVLARAVANPRTRGEFAWAETQLVEAARSMNADELANEVTTFIERIDQDGPEPPAPRQDELHANRVGDRVKLDGDFDLETGIPLLEAIGERTDQLFRRDQQVTEANPNDPVAARPPAQRRAEALTELVLAGAGASSNPARREPLFNVFVDEWTLFRLTVSDDFLSELADRSIIPIRTLEVWRCEAAMSRVLLDAQGVLLDYGRSERYANRQLRRALAARDRGCAVPGCDRPPAYCDAHHIVFWEDDGHSKIDNLVLACRHHHRMIHAGHLSVEMINRRPHFHDRFGRPVHAGRWRPPPQDLAA